MEISIWKGIAGTKLTDKSRKVVGGEVNSKWEEELERKVVPKERTRIVAEPRLMWLVQEVNWCG